jgi:hypothetical protein
MTEVEVPSTRSRLTAGMGLSADPLPPVHESHQEGDNGHTPALAPQQHAEDNLSPSDAVQHMRDVSRLLRTWRSGLERPD